MWGGSGSVLKVKGHPTKWKWVVSVGESKGNRK